MLCFSLLPEKSLWLVFCGSKSKTGDFAHSKSDLLATIFAKEKQLACKPVALMSGARAGSIIVSIPQATGIFPESYMST